MDAGSANELPAFPKKPPMKLNRQGTFKQGSNGKVDTVDISQSPRGSRSNSRALDRQALDQIQRVKIADDVTPEQTEDEADDADEAQDKFQDSLAVSPRSSNGSNVSTPRSLQNAKPTLVLKRQGTFVQRRDGQSDQVELSPGAEIKRRLSAEATQILHESIGDGDENESEYEDDYENATEDEQDAGPEFSEARVIRVPTTVDDVADEYADEEHEQEQEPITKEPVQKIAEESVEEQQPAGIEEEDEECQEEDTFEMMSTSLQSKSRPAFGHNRKGTFLQSSSGKAVALDMSKSATITSEEILNPAEAELVPCSEGTDEDCKSEEEDDHPGPMTPMSPPKRPIMERKGTFIQSKNGTTKQIALGGSTGERRASDHALNAIVDVQEEEETEESEVSTEEQSSPANSSDDRIRLGSLNSGDGTAAGVEETSAPVAEERSSVSDLPLSAPEPLLQRKATYIQTKSGHTDTLLMSSTETFAAIPAPASFDIIEEDQESEDAVQHVNNEAAPVSASDAIVEQVQTSMSSSSDPACDVAQPSQPAERKNRVDPIKRQAYLKNRKGTFAANENGKMVKVALTGAGDLDNDMSMWSMGPLDESADSFPNGAMLEEAEEETDTPLVENDTISETSHHESVVAPAQADDAGSFSVQETSIGQSVLEHGTQQHVDLPDTDAHIETVKHVQERRVVPAPDQGHEHLVMLPPICPATLHTRSDSHDTNVNQNVDQHDSHGQIDTGRKRNSIGKEEKRVQISSEIVVIESVETDRQHSTRSTPRHRASLATPDHNIQKMLETAERDRQYRARQLRKIEKTRLRSKSFQQTTLPKLLVTPIRAQQVTPADLGLEKILRPTSAERFVETYRVYAPQPAANHKRRDSTSKKKSLGLKGRRASSTN